MFADMSKVYFIAGATASGKSQLALELAQRLDAVIVSADAYQVYRELPLLSAAPSAADLAACRHYLIGNCSVSEEWDAATHARAADEYIRAALALKRHVVVVGGSGLYLKFISHGIAEAPAGDEQLRARLAELSPQQQVQQLLQLDAAAAELVNLKNPRYVQRALEIVLLSGKSLAEWRQNWQQPQYPSLGFKLDFEVQAGDERIRRRCETLLDAGLLQEMAALPQHISATAARTLGLQPSLQLLRGEISREQWLEELYLRPRQYAKRQRSWLRRETWLQGIDASLPLAAKLDYILAQ